MSGTGQKETMQGCVYVACHESYLHHTSWVMFFHRLISQLICFYLCFYISLLLPFIKFIIKSLLVWPCLSAVWVWISAFLKAFPWIYVCSAYLSASVSVCLSQIKDSALSFSDQHRSHHLGKGMKDTLQKSLTEFYKGLSDWLQLTSITNTIKSCPNAAFSTHDGYSLHKATSSLSSVSSKWLS